MHVVIRPSCEFNESFFVIEILLRTQTEWSAEPSFCVVTQHEITSALAHTCFFFSQTKEMYYMILCVLRGIVISLWQKSNYYCANIHSHSELMRFFRLFAPEERESQKPLQKLGSRDFCFFVLPVIVTAFEKKQKIRFAAADEMEFLFSQQRDFL